MRAGLREALAAGAWGMSTGLVYPPGTYAQTGEIVEVGRELAPTRALYASHIRNEAADLLAAVDEAIEIGEAIGAPVEISHLKAAGRRELRPRRGGRGADHGARAPTARSCPRRRLPVRSRQHVPEPGPAAVGAGRRRRSSSSTASAPTTSGAGSGASSRPACPAGTTSSRRPAAGRTCSSRASTGPTSRPRRAARSPTPLRPPARIPSPGRWTCSWPIAARR